MLDHDAMAVRHAKLLIAASELSGMIGRAE
jgi:hypothetical protein